MLKIRSGLGYDIHRIKRGKGMYIGGIQVSEDLEFIAHSDGDLLIHALIDSLLGAIGEEDIGELFPDNDTKYKGIKSEKLLAKVKKIYEERNVEIINIDCVVITEVPKISPFKVQIRENISKLLSIEYSDFNIKAKTKEKVGEIGRGEAMECFCTSMVRFK
ncbi:MAG: 2-C-methyl-D-erythritol 2,4-cyclodiphosphate synthase [Acidobacteriota bacterium]